MSDIEESTKCIKLDQQTKDKCNKNNSNNLKTQVDCTDSQNVSAKGSTMSEKSIPGMDNELDFEIETDEKNQLKTEEKDNDEGEKAADHGDDDGECTDDDDDDDDNGSLEEGELKEKDEGNSKPIRQVCRFYNRGQCFYGNVCRFLHLNNESKGNYNMFAPPQPPRNYESNLPIDGMMSHQSMGMMHRSGPRTGPDFMPIPPPPIPPLASNTELPPIESAWEKGLREAKELVKQGKIRKKDPDFEDKRLNLGLIANEKRELDKENDTNLKQYKKKKRQNDNVFRYEEAEFYEPEDSRTNYNRYENFEMKFYNERSDRSRERRPMLNEERKEKGPKIRKDRERMRDDRIKPNQSRKAEEFFDPWRRSKSPKNNQRRTRSRSFGSFSSVSSYSYSSRSSCSYSRSSSRSSGRSSRSPSRRQKRLLSPTHALPSPKSPILNKFVDMKKKPLMRSRSRSISMDSVSSASSSPHSRSSSADSMGRRRNSQLPNLKKHDDKTVGEKVELKTPTSNLYQEPSRQIKPDKPKDVAFNVHDEDIDPLEEKFHTPVEKPDMFLPTLPHVMPISDRIKEPVKGLYKQPIKLTLLNKNPQSKLTTFPKKDFDLKTKTTDDSSRVGTLQPPVKRPPSPPPQAVAPKPVAVPQKKSASSRRDELLKQLKAVEDAIARKRAKFC